MGLYHFFITSLMKPEDGFDQRLRKSAVGLCLFPGLPLSLLFTVTSALAVDGSQYTISQFCINMVRTACATVSYGWLWKTHHVGGMQATLLCITGLLVLIPRLLNVPDSDNTSYAICMALIGVILRQPQVRLYLLGCFTFACIGQWNVAHVNRDPSLLLVLPGYPTHWTAMDIFIKNMGPTIFVALGIIVLLRVTDESVRRGVAMQGANQMTLRILKCQRSYDTESIALILEEFKADGVVDPELLVLYDGMNKNLESYRPFLPNYLFNNDEGDDIIDDGAGAPPSTSGGDDEGAISSSSDVVSQVGSHVTSKASRGGRTKSGTGSGVLSKIHSFVEGQSSAAPGVSDLNHSAGVSAAIGRSLMKRGPLYEGTVSMVLVDIAVPRMVENPKRHLNVDILTTVVRNIYTLSKGAKASIHSMLGDTVQLTWNATQSVALPETKAALFLANLATSLQSVDISSPRRRPFTVSAAVCSGRAVVHSLTVESQQSLIIEAPWLPALEGCFALAKQHSTSGAQESVGGTLLMDAATANACITEVEGCAVEAITYHTASHTEVRDKYSFLAHHPHTNPIRAGVSTTSTTRETTTTQTEKKVLVYEILGERAHADDEWMYQLQAGAETVESNVLALQLKAITAMLKGCYGDAATDLEAAVDLRDNVRKHSGTTTPRSAPEERGKKEMGRKVMGSPSLTEALLHQCHTFLTDIASVI